MASNYGRFTMAHRFRIQYPNSPDIEFSQYEEAIYAIRRVGVDHATLAELDENGNVLSILDNDELRIVVAEFADIPSLSVYYGSPKGRLVDGE